MSERDPLALAGRYGPYALLLVVAAFMLWVRLIPVESVITDTAVYFSGNDPWYHDRMVHLTVRNFPATTPFDPWSNYPYGTGRHSGFGGLFDQLIALAALVVGLGSPSDRLIDVTVALAPAVFGALTAIPTYVIARHLTDRRWGLVAPVLLALFGGAILSRTVVGAADHQSAEALFGTIAVVGFAYAIAAAYRESPMLEDVQDRNWPYLRGSVLAGIAGGVAVAAYLALWSPGVMLLFTFGVFVVVQLAREHRAGDPTDPIAIATVVSMATAGVLTLLNARTYELNSSAFSLLQPLVAFGLAFGAIVLFALSRYAEREGYDRDRFPVAVAALIAGAFAMMWLVFPRGIQLLRSLFVRVYSFGYFTTQTAGTVAEIRPGSLGGAFGAYGMVLFLAAAGAILLAYRVYRERRPIDLLVLLWSATMVSAYFTMARFGYYLAVNVAVLAGFGTWWIATSWLDFDLSVERLRERDVDLYQVIGLLVILLLVVPGNVVGVSGQQPAWEQADSPFLSGTDQAWYDGLTWMRENTPEEPLEYYSRWERPADGDYAYPEGAYGVMSWWDYGHWITVVGHRIPYANPFQQNPPAASAYLQATNETRANLILEALPSFADDPDSIANLSTAQLRQNVSEQTDQEASENGRYVVIDDQMAGGKFAAITQWAGPGQREYYQQSQFRLGGQNQTLPTTTDRYEQTMLGRLYLGDAGGLSHYRLVHEVDQYSIVGGYIEPNRGVRPLTSLRLRGDWQSLRQGGIPPAIAQSRLTNQVFRIGNGGVYNAHVESSVKTFERVEGAELTGSVPNTGAGTSVYAVLELQTNTGRNFTYVQQATTDAEGSFSMTVPYATDDTVAPADGGTDTAVRATGPYAVRVGHPQVAIMSGNATVPEPAVYEGRTIQVEVTATEGNASTTAGDESAGQGMAAVAIRVGSP